MYALPREPPSPFPCHPSRSSQSSRLGSGAYTELCYTAASHELSVLHMIVYVNATLPIRPTLSFPRCVKSILYVCVSIPSLQIGSSVLFF